MTSRKYIFAMRFKLFQNKHIAEMKALELIVMGRQVLHI